MVAQNSPANPQRFSVQRTRIGQVIEGRWVETPAFKVVGYNGPGTNFPVESDATVDEVVG